jgi:hypothetical protein
MSAYVGIDVHKRFCQAAVMSEDGRILCETRFQNTIDGAKNLVNLARSHGSHIRAVVEPSGALYSHLNARDMAGPVGHGPNHANLADSGNHESPAGGFAKSKGIPESDSPF